jgi:parallel beta-helix repeat protein
MVKCENMRKVDICMALAFVLSTSLLSLAYSSSSGNQNVTVSASGVILYPASGSAPPTTYSYIFQISSSEYQDLSGSTKSLIYQSTSSSTAWNYLFGSSGIASAGSTVLVSTGTYVVDNSWNINMALRVYFATGAVLNELSMANVYSPWTGTTGGGIPMIVIYASNIIMTGGTLNGNASVQLPAANTYITGAYYCNNGIQVESSVSNCVFQNMTLHDIRCYGLWVVRATSNCTVQNCTVYNVGANGIMFGGGGTSAPDCAAVNNVVYNVNDVGIDSYSSSTKITGNYVYDIDNGPYYGYNNAGWAIAIEDGGGGSSSSDYTLIANNTIITAPCAIALEGIGPTYNYILVSGNKIASCSSAGVALGQSGQQVANSIFEWNTITSCAYGIYLGNSASSDDIYGNTFTSCSTNISSGSYNTNVPSLVAVTMTSSPLGVDFVTANGVAGYAGSLSCDPYTFYASEGSSVTISANNVAGYSFVSWNDGGAQSHTIIVPSSDQTFTAGYS